MMAPNQRSHLQLGAGISIPAVLLLYVQTIGFGWMPSDAPTAWVAGAELAYGGFVFVVVFLCLSALSRRRLRRRPSGQPTLISVL